MAIDTIQIEDEAQWHRERAKDVTASVAGALLGVHPYTTAWGLYQLKSGKLQADPEETPAMRRGRHLEPVAVALLREDRPNWQILPHPVGCYFRDTEARIGATPDVLAVNENDERGVVQIKSVEPSIFRRDWRTPEGHIEPPLWITVQAIIEAKLTRSKWAAVAPLVVGFGLEMPIIPIPVHDGVWDKVAREVAEFWKRIAEDRPYDPDYARDAATIAQLNAKDNGQTVDLSGDNELPGIVDELERARADGRDADKRQAAAKAGITHKMGEAAFARMADGRRISNALQRRAGYEVKPAEFRTIKILKA